MWSKGSEMRRRWRRIAVFGLRQIIELPPLENKRSRGSCVMLFHLVLLLPCAIIILIFTIIMVFDVIATAL